MTQKTWLWWRRADVYVVDHDKSKRIDRQMQTTYKIYIYICVCVCALCVCIAEEIQRRKTAQPCVIMSGPAADVQAANGDLLKIEAFAPIGSGYKIWCVRFNRNGFHD